MLPEERFFRAWRDDRRFRLRRFALGDIGLHVGDHQEAADHDQPDDDGEQAPARHEDELVADVLVGLDADKQEEQAEGDGAGVERLAHGALDRSRLFDAVRGNGGHFAQTFSTSGRPRMPEGRKISTMARIEKAATSL